MHPLIACLAETPPVIASNELSEPPLATTPPPPTSRALSEERNLANRSCFLKNRRTS